MNPPSVLQGPRRLIGVARRHRAWLAMAVFAVVAVTAVGPGPARDTAARPPAGAAEIDAWLDAQLRDSGIAGAALVVVRDGRIVHERGFGSADDAGRPVSAETPFMLGSLSKSITATAVLQLVDRGLVGLDRPAVTYLPGFRLAGPDAGAAVTVRQLLTHTSGIPGRAGTEPLGRPATSLAAQVDALADVAPTAVPGARFEYSNANYLVLGRLVEVVSGESFGAYLERHVFGPLGMREATTDPAIAAANGLSRAHRLWFGLADSHPALDRTDFAPAGFIAASADDVGRFLVAQLDGGRFDGRSIVSSEAVSEMQTGTVATGLDGQRAGMGWMESSLDGERIVAHTGSTTDMAAIQVLVPDEHLGIAVLMNTQSTLYELLHKPDAIGLGVVSLALGHEPEGTLQAFYPVLDLVLLVLLVLSVRGLVRLVRAPVALRRRGGSLEPPPGPDDGSRYPVLGRVRRLAGRAFRFYLDLLVPAFVLVRAPEVFGAGWPTLARIDIGLVLLVLVVIRLLDGAIRLGRRYGVVESFAGRLRRASVRPVARTADR